MAAAVMSMTVVVGLSAYFPQADSVGASATPGSAAVASAATPTSAGSAVAPTSSGSTVTTIAAATPNTDPATTAASAASGLADGTYAGATDTNKWGPVQVQITVTSGQISNVVALQTPTDDRKSISINQRATPTLASEALSAQTADIDTVSGATYTSDSYKVSLQSAIDLAKTAVSAGATS